MKQWILSTLAALVLASPAFADAPRTISYQGILTDANGNFIPDGNYGLTVRLYDASANGNLLYTELQNPVAVVKGGYNILIGSVTALNIAFDKPLWLTLQVGADPELTPRVALASNPYAMGLSLPIDARANGTPAAFMARNSTGPSLAGEGPIQLFAPAISSPFASMEAFGLIGGRVVVKDEANNNTGRMEPDGNGTGGFFTVFRSATAAGFTVNGNDGTEEPIVSVSGSARSSVFDMSQPADASVQLPTGAINSTEEFNEPGVAEVYANSSVSVGLGITIITSRTITAPDDGFVLVIGGGHCEIGHVNGTDSRILYGANDVNSAFATSEWVAGVPSTAPTGNYRVPVPFTGVWPVTAGAHTFYLLAQRLGAASGMVLNDPTIALVYLPTSYGTVTGNKAFIVDAIARTNGPLTQADIDAERVQAAEFDRDRAQRELNLVRAHLDAIQNRLTNNLPAAAAGSPK